MGIFGRDDQNENGKPMSNEPKHRPKPVTNAGAPSTVIATSAHVDGELKGSGDIRIEGNLSGRIDSTSSVLIAETGHIEAEVKAETVIVAGKVDGNITAEQKIELTPSADMRGDLNAPRITISEGATFEGQIVMSGKKSPQKPSASTKNEKPAKGDKADKDAPDAKDDKSDTTAKDDAT